MYDIYKQTQTNQAHRCINRLVVPRAGRKVEWGGEMSEGSQKEKEEGEIFLCREWVLTYSQRSRALPLAIGVEGMDVSPSPPS